MCKPLAAMSLGLPRGAGRHTRTLMGDVTVILQRVSHGERLASEELLPLVYEELRRLAAARMLQERPGHTLQPTALVHEAWLRLAGTKETAWQNLAHFCLRD